ncbi:Nuclear transcription factor Y subunit A [Trema orientale]|uniref:Nuclear transcription factor Y subunit n=1 Tax=Trema orientale TaxID=63057 RepID=A0A2P5FEI5_TREOI|nr:Nuclear transcription factor Y subunit A [Trema orientale]
MQNLLKKDSSVSTIQSESQLFVGCSSWENSSESHAQQSSISQSLSLNMGFPAQHHQNTKQLILQFQDQDSSSTQSTGQSHPEVASMKGSNLYGPGMISTLQGYNETQGRSIGGHIKQVSSIGTQDFVFSSQLDYSQPMAHIPFNYAEPYYGGLLAAAAYGPHAMIHHSQMVGMAPARVPLPLDLTEDEPIYVNAKQYRAILRRRRFRAKLEAQNKLLKVRKPYLHESRHLHALKRARGSGGRFLNTKDVQESNCSPAERDPDNSASARPHLNKNMMESEVHQPENYKDGSSTTSCSEVTSASNSDDIFQQQELRFSVYPMHAHIVDSCTDGNQHHTSALR